MHEIESGRASSVGIEIIVSDTDVPGCILLWEEIGKRSAKVISFMDQTWHEWCSMQVLHAVEKRIVYKGFGAHFDLSHPSNFNPRIHQPSILASISLRSLHPSAFIPVNMCDRDIYTRKYRNCTASPKHIIIKYDIRGCPFQGTSDCKGYKDNNYGASTVHGGICPKC